MRKRKVGALLAVLTLGTSACAGATGGAQPPATGAPSTGTLPIGPTRQPDSPSGSRAPTTTVSLVERCGTDVEGDRPQPFHITTSSGETLYAVRVGAGSRALVLVHGSGRRGLCNWTAELPWLADAGYLVIAFDAACVGESSCRTATTRDVDDLVDVLDHVRRDGAVATVVVAASAGGPLAAEVATRRGAALDAAVALSPAGLEPGSAGRVPLLIAHAQDDESTSQARLKAAAESTGAVLRILPAGTGHAQELLYSGQGPSAFRASLFDFLKQHTDKAG